MALLFAIVIVKLTNVLLPTTVTSVVFSISNTTSLTSTEALALHTVEFSLHVTFILLVK